MKKLLIILCVLMASQVFSQRVFYRSAMKADTLTVTVSQAIVDLTATGNAVADSIYARAINQSKATIKGTSTTTDFLMVRTDKNITRTSVAQGADTAAVYIAFSALGKPELTMRGNTGIKQFGVDSLGNTTIAGTVKLPKHTLAAGDSVQGTLFNSSTDSSLWMWNGTAWNKYATLASPTFTGTVSATTINATTVAPTHMTLALHAIVAGDSVFGNTLLRNTDTILVMWNGSAWKTIADMGP